MIHLFPEGVTGRGPRRSMAILSIGAPVGTVPSDARGLLCDLLFFKHVSHSPTHSLIVSLILNQTKSLVILERVFLYPKCPASKLLWVASRSPGTSVFGSINLELFSFSARLSLQYCTDLKLGKKVKSKSCESSSW